MVIGVLGCLLWLFVPDTAVGQWQSGGTLQHATGAARQQADDSNRLATAADMVVAVVKEGNTTIPYHTVDDVRMYAELLSGCITQATKTKVGATLTVKYIIANGWAYLNEHRGWTYYRQCRRGGYPLGSGGIELSNKFICHVRLKRSGAWWYESNSNRMLTLRCTKYNGTLDQVFARHQQRLRKA